MLRWIAVLCTVVLVACVPRAPQPDGGGGDHPSAADTLRGTVEIVGSEPGTAVALLMDGGTRAVTLEGARGVLEQMQGLEVMVRGVEARPAVFRVSWAVVRAVDGVPAVDGVLARNGAGYVLVTAEGERIPLPRLPEALRAHVGSRVWISGPPPHAMDAYGIVDDRS